MGMEHNKKLILSLCSNIVVFYFVGLSNVWTHEQAIENRNIYPLIDQGFRLIDYNIDLTYMQDYLLIAIVGITFILFLINPERRYILYRWSLMLNILFGIRIFTVPSTILTRPLELDENWKSCKTLDYDYNGWLSPFEVLFQDKMTCFDFIYSGHMVNFVTCILLINKYVELVLVLRILLWSIVGVESYFIIATRSHYLVDIELAIVLTIFLWFILEYREKIQELKDKLYNEKEEIEMQELELEQEEIEQVEV